MWHRNKAKADVFEWPNGRTGDSLERLRFAAASKLCLWHEHQAGGGSFYVTIDDSLILRFADHENTSTQHRAPDFNFVKRMPSSKEFQEIVCRIHYARLCKNVGADLKLTRRADSKLTRGKDGHVRWPSVDNCTAWIDWMASQALLLPR